MKKALSFLLISLLTLSIAFPALAAVVEHDIAGGSLNITEDNVNADGYRVYQTGTGSTDNTISIGPNVIANITLDGVDIESSGSSINIDDSASLELTVEGDNSLSSTGRDATIHVAGGDLTIKGSGTLDVDAVDSAAIGSNVGEDMSGSITIGGSVTVDAFSDYDDEESAAIGSGKDGDMSGTITIQDSADVTALADDDGAGIGSGCDGDMSGTIIVKDSAVVDAESDNDGAGIGSGEDGDMSGTIHITGNADVTAFSDYDGPGIGAGEDRELSGTVLIDGNSKVWARSDNDGAGIGAGEDGKIGPDGKIIIGGNASVTAIGEDDGTGIGSGENKPMEGTIIIRDSAKVKAYGGSSAAAIGSNDSGEMTGSIQILGNATVTTGAANGGGEPIDGKVGYIGGSSSSDHDSDVGSFTFSESATINGVSGGNVEALKDFVNMALDEEGNPLNLSIIPAEESTWTVWNDACDISAGPVLKSVSGIREKALTAGDEEYALLTADMEGKLLRACELSFKGEHDLREFVLSFKVGTAYAGHAVELRYLDGENNVHSALITVDGNGFASLGMYGLGAFALILK